MYIWVILATFLAMLASYTLSVRPDMRAVTVEPVAEAVLGKFIAQHKAAQNYIKYRKPPYVERGTVEFTPGVIPVSNSEEGGWIDEMPYGFKPSEDPEYTSAVFCLSADLGASVACNTKKVRRFVVTYGPIPRRWQQLNSDLPRPNMDFINAMRRMINVGEPMGYIEQVDGSVTEDNPTGSNIMIVDRDRSMKVYIPQNIVGEIESECNPTDGCLVYMSKI